VSFEVKKGSVVTIVGANGAGKSTILNTIVGLHRAKEGSILYKGEDITKTAPDRLVRKGMRLVPKAGRFLRSIPWKRTCCWELMRRRI
jgi:branched-chain amino acid transport system ATP-binding protein